MEGNKSKFESNLRELGHRVHFSIMSCIDKWGQYRCLVSNHQFFAKDSIYSIYEFPALLRVLGRKADLFTSNVQKELYGDTGPYPYEGTSGQLIVILNWDQLEREFLYLEFPSSEEQFIVQFISLHKKILSDYSRSLRKSSNEGDFN